MGVTHDNNDKKKKAKERTACDHHFLAFYGILALCHCNEEFLRHQKLDS